MENRFDFSVFDQTLKGYLTNTLQHKTLDERLHAAVEFRKEFDWDIDLVVDNMDNVFNACFAIWPERYVCVDKDGVVTYIQQGESDENGYEGRIDREIATLKHQIMQLLK